ncbi:MAG: hypothetical protein QW518_04110 [Thermofilaceae archaeon]
MSVLWYLILRMVPYHKGRRSEEELVRLLKQMGVEAVRVPLSGARPLQGSDVLITLNSTTLGLSVKWGTSCPNIPIGHCQGYVAFPLSWLPHLPRLQGLADIPARFPKAVLRELARAQGFAGRQKRGTWMLVLPKEVLWKPGSA